MYMIVAPIQIKPGYREAFIEAMLGDAQGSVNSEPGCLRFDVIQDGQDPNRIWLYEAYKDELSFQDHQKAPHYIKWRDTVKEWKDEELQGAGQGSYNIWPSDKEWK